MKLAALYTVWNGLELLNQSIETISPHVDTIVVCWQLYSNKGNKSEEIIDFIENKLNKRAKIVEFKPVNGLNTKQNERAKHNLMIQTAMEIGCTHFFISACDHFYDPTEFQDAKFKILHYDYDVTFTKMYTYYKHPTWQIHPIEDYHMPFICKLNPETHIDRVPNYPVHIDPSIQIVPINNFHVFDQSEVMMHHYSMIRSDIKNKFKNAAASIRWKPKQIENFISEYESAQVGSEISYFGNRKIIEVGNYFNL